MLSQMITLDLKEGLEHRAASEIIQFLQEFDSAVTMKYDGRTANCKSIINLLALETGAYPTVEVSVVGDEETADMEDFIAFLHEIGRTLGDGAD